jgi:hypothetical protein
MGLGQNGLLNGQTTAATLWSTALALNIGGSRIPAKRQGTDRRAFACALAWFPGKFHLRKSQQKKVFVKEEGYPYFV